MNLDLDIRNYDLSDLETFFRLTKPYVVSDIELNETQIRSLLLSSGHLSKEVVRDLILFLASAKNILIESLQIRPPVFIRTVQQETILHPTPKPVVYTQNSEFTPGQLNPLDTRTLTRCLSIDTRFRTQQTSSADFHLNIPNKIQKVTTMECNSFEMAALPNISAALGNNFLFILIGEEAVSFVLPTGYYTTTLLMVTLNQLFVEQNYHVQICLEPNGSQKTMILSPHEIELDFTRNERGENDKNIDFFAKMGRLLGFTRPKYTGKSSYLSETTVNPNISLPYFYLSVEDFQNHSSGFESAFPQILSSPSILARIVPQEKMKIMSLSRKYFGPVDLNRFHIKLLDPRGNVLDLNQNDYSFCLLFKTIYEQ